MFPRSERRRTNGERNPDECRRHSGLLRQSNGWPRISLRSCGLRSDRKRHWRPAPQPSKKFCRMMSVFENAVRRSDVRPTRPGLTGRQTMRVMVLVKATEDSEKGFVLTPETRKMLEAMGKFNDELRKAGILITADGLTESAQGK